jgi:hypothetical protein
MIVSDDQKKKKCSLQFKIEFDVDSLGKYFK